jgi:hypothetical protein
LLSSKAGRESDDDKGLNGEHPLVRAIVACLVAGWQQETPRRWQKQT